MPSRAARPASGGSFPISRSRTSTGKRQALRLQDAEAHGRGLHQHKLPHLQEVCPQPRPHREGLRREGRRLPVREPHRPPTSRMLPRFRRPLCPRHRWQAHRRVRRDRDHRGDRPRCRADACSIAARSTISMASATRSMPRDEIPHVPRSMKPSRASCRSSARPRRPAARSNPIPRRPPLSPLTYHARIERIVQANCVECHRAGGAAPFALETYEDVVAHKGMIKKVVDRGTMPPWFAADREGQAFALLERPLTHRFGPERSDRLARAATSRRATRPMPRCRESTIRAG